MDWADCWVLLLTHLPRSIPVKRQWNSTQPGSGKRAHAVQVEGGGQGGGVRRLACVQRVQGGGGGAQHQEAGVGGQEHY